MLDVLVIGVDRRDPEPHGRLDLVGAPAQDRQLDRRGLDRCDVRTLAIPFGQDRLEELGKTGSAAIERAGRADAASSSRATSSRRNWLSRLIGTIGRPSIVASRPRELVDRPAQAAELGLRTRSRSAACVSAMRQRLGRLRPVARWPVAVVP